MPQVVLSGTSSLYESAAPTGPTMRVSWQQVMGPVLDRKVTAKGERSRRGCPQGRPRREYAACTPKNGPAALSVATHLHGSARTSHSTTTAPPVRWADVTVRRLPRWLASGRLPWAQDEATRRWAESPVAVQAPTARSVQ